ncbi:MAG: HDIG domain-containing protein [Synergistales bacterium]|nr:HDIG domain-containing protein [Synergistales bacterium]
MKNGNGKSRKSKDTFNFRNLSLSTARLDRDTVLPVLALLVVAFIILSSRWALQENRTGFEVHKVATRPYRAITSVGYIDQEATEKLRQKMELTRVSVMVSDVPDEQHIQEYIRKLSESDFGDLPLQDDLKELLFSLEEPQRAVIARACSDIAEQLVALDIHELPDKDQVTDAIWEQLESRALSRADKNLAFQILDALLTPPEVLDQDLTEHLQAKVLTDVSPVQRYLDPGDLIIAEGEIITPAIGEILKDQGYPQRKYPFHQLFLLIVGIAFWVSWFRIKIKQENYNLAGRNPWIYIVTLQSGGWLLLFISHMMRAEGSGLLVLAGWCYLTMSRPVAFQVIIAASLLGAFLVAGFSPGLVLVIGFMGFFAAMSGYLFFKHVTSRTNLWKELFLLGIYLSLTAIIVRWSIGIYFSWDSLLRYGVASFIWSLFAILSLPLLENMFDVLSPLRLMDLSHPSQQLLKKLQIEAPGTYHHSLMVGTLAEAAANRIGLDANLVKAGAYYHDIGKLKRPHYYVENQMGGDNVHNRITPSLSALSIIAHVREGIELAREYKLPQRIIDFIAEHHGKTCLSYFYRKARNLGEKVPRDQFCYPGPKPKTKETALLMIVDSVEAAVRADIDNITSIQDIEKAIEGVIETKIAEGQMEKVDFTLKELSEMKEVLLSTLQSMYHTRRVQKISPLNGNNTNEEAKQ